MNKYMIYLAMLRRMHARYKQATNLSSHSPRFFSQRLKRVDVFFLKKNCWALGTRTSLIFLALSPLPPPTPSTPPKKTEIPSPRACSQAILGMNWCPSFRCGKWNFLETLTTELHFSFPRPAKCSQNLCNYHHIKGTHLLRRHFFWSRPERRSYNLCNFHLY